MKGYWTTNYSNLRRHSPGLYGDWTTPHLAPWKDTALEHSIQPIQQFAYTTGKNSTDSAMIIDAMDLFYAGNLDGFCLVSSDSDFTRLASRLKESGKFVYGFGEKKTPTALVSACDRFRDLVEATAKHFKVNRTEKGVLVSRAKAAKQ